MKRNRNPLTKAQSRLLKNSLRRLLGDGLLNESEASNTVQKNTLIQDAFSLNVLNDESTLNISTGQHRVIKTESLKLP